MLAGKPMVQWTIEAALEATNISGVIVSSDDDKILTEVTQMGAKSFKRSSTLSANTATTFDVCKEVLSSPLPFRNDQFALLLPTSPLRIASDIDNAYSKFWSSKANCLMSISEFEYPPAWALMINNGKIKPIETITLNSWYDKKNKANFSLVDNYKNKRQNLVPLYKHDGNIIMCKTKAFLKANDWLDMNCIPWYTPKEHSVDVNTINDFQYAEYLLGQVRS